MESVCIGLVCLAEIGRIDPKHSNQPLRVSFAQAGSCGKGLGDVGIAKVLNKPLCRDGLLTMPGSALEEIRKKRRHSRETLGGED